MFKKIFAVSAVALAGVASTSTHAEMMTGQAIPVEGESDQSNVVELKVETKTWKCPGCNTNEQYVLQQLQERTKVSDKNALAAIMGNIKQESNFTANICEGGARVPYHKCHRGGYGLIQWTSVGRYRGLGSFCKKYNCDPSSLEGQTRYMINEPVFQRYLPEFEGHGFSISQYMVPSYYWLGWGIKGLREQFAHNYAKRLVWA